MLSNLHLLNTSCSMPYTCDLDSLMNNSYTNNIIPHGFIPKNVPTNTKQPIISTVFYITYPIMTETSNHFMMLTQ